MIGHERLAKDLPHGAQVVTSIEDDPWSPAGETQKIKVLRSIRDDPLAGLLSRGQIDATQFRAGRRWQMLWEHSQGGVIRAIDPLKEPVDGGGPNRADITDSQMEAFKKLGEAGLALGPAGDALVCLVLADGLAIKEIARREGDLTRIRIDYLGARFRECLETLAEHWGFAGKTVDERSAVLNVRGKSVQKRTLAVTDRESFLSLMATWRPAS